MKSRLITALALLMAGVSTLSCGPALPLAPRGYVPSRNNLPKDVYGSYFSFYTEDNSYEGELIGMRNDSIVVLGRKLSIVPYRDVKDGQLIIYTPNRQTGGAIIMIPNILLLVHTGTYGSAPAATALVLSAVDGIAMLPALGFEKEISNYKTWRDNWSTVMKYSRFPGGIPQDLDLSTLTRRREVEGR